MGARPWTATQALAPVGGLGFSNV
ncbi:uncharacterized protein METZ01_LOCUS390195 [marine metagenome]|uniref:Uncharacterized protein n=1 Tax=marine metagenome TaxID=408172 RepID=A0A382UUJ0_9ZZZZ